MDMEYHHYKDVEKRSHAKGKAFEQASKRNKYDRGLPAVTDTWKNDAQ